MYNLRYKILFFIGVMIVGVQTVLGTINASQYYTDYTREFLGYLGHKNPSNVPIRKMDRNDSQHKTVRPSGLMTAGYTDATGIYLNEDFFAGNYSEGINLFTCAHEAAHYALGHIFQKGRSNLEIEKEADVQAARMLCRHGYRWVVKQEVAHLKQQVDAGQGHLTDGKHPTIQQQYVYLSKVLATKSESNSYEAGMEEIKDLLNQLNSFSREQKIVIASALTMGFMSWFK